MSQKVTISKRYHKREYARDFCLNFGKINQTFYNVHITSKLYNKKAKKATTYFPQHNIVQLLLVPKIPKIFGTG
jgi:hypothetical protein